MKLLISHLVFTFSVLIAQVNPSINVGQTKNEVLALIQEDIFADQYLIKTTNSSILVSVRVESQLENNSIVQYFFKDNILVKIKWTASVPSPNEMLSFIYQQHLARYGEPIKTTIERNKAYLWKFPNKVGYNYYFIAFSDWFQKKCFVNIITLHKI